jgi:hypothetical protein
VRIARHNEVVVRAKSGVLIFGERHVVLRLRSWLVMVLRNLSL